MYDDEDMDYCEVGKDAVMDIVAGSDTSGHAGDHVMDSPRAILRQMKEAAHEKKGHHDVGPNH